jgi:hypothetical protein
MGSGSGGGDDSGSGSGGGGDDSGSGSGGGGDDSGSGSGGGEKDSGSQDPGSQSQEEGLGDDLPAVLLGKTLPKTYRGFVKHRKDPDSGVSIHQTPKGKWYYYHPGFQRFVPTGFIERYPPVTSED